MADTIKRFFNGVFSGKPVDLNHVEFDDGCDDGPCEGCGRYECNCDEQTMIAMEKERGM